MCPDEQKNAIFKDLNPHKHTQIMKTIFFFASMGQVTDRIRGKKKMLLKRKTDKNRKEFKEKIGIEAGCPAKT